MFDIIIIGAGASGLVSAIVSAKRGKKVLLLEKNSKVGKKLLATGNGRCNITNQKPISSRFHSNNRYFIEQVLSGYSYQDIKKFFKSIGLELIESKEGKVFPMSLQAQSVVDILELECRELGVKIICNCHVERVIKNSSGYSVDEFKSHKVVLSTGHISAPSLGGVVDGLVFARKFGHKTIDSFPSLVQLTSSIKDIRQLSGVKIESRITLKTPKGLVERSGDVLFTNYGISGLATLDISRWVMIALIEKKEVELFIDLMPKMSGEQLKSLMKKSIRKKSSRSIEHWVQGFIHKKLIGIILERAKIDKLLESQIELSHIEKIVEAIKVFRLRVDGSRGYKGAEVATGGVDTREINPKTMESKKQKGLYFTGEVLDVDGDRGGFNLHFAWVCGLRVGEHI
jgi:predicted Rossmann fold flavoprotein